MRLGARSTTSVTPITIAQMRPDIASDPSGDAHHPVSHASTLLAVLTLMALGFAVRLALGLRTQLDADEATFALAGLHITHGHFALMEPNGQYLGALDAYIAAPFIALFGPNTLAIRLSVAAIGAVYVLSMYWLGRQLFRTQRAALLTALVAAVFPLFTVYWSSKLRGGYVEMPVFEALALGLCARAGWISAPRLRWWALLGLVCGAALWSDVLFIVVVAVIAAALLLRGPAIGWSAWRRGVGVACLGGAVGLAPWIAYNVPNKLHSIRAIPRVFTGFRSGAEILVNHQLPTLIGGTSSCGHDVVPPLISDVALLALLVAIVWMRRQSISNLLTGKATRFEPLDVVLVRIPATIA